MPPGNEAVYGDRGGDEVSDTEMFLFGDCEENRLFFWNSMERKDVPLRIVYKDVSNEVFFTHGAATAPRD